MARILVVDDEEKIGYLLSETLTDEGHKAEYVTDPEKAWTMIQNGRFDLVITDLKMEPIDGQELLRRITDGKLDLDVAVLTAHGSTDSAVAAMKAGAIDYLAKPLDLEEMTLFVERWQRERHTRARAATFAADLARSFEHDLIGDSRAIAEVKSLIERVARADATVLVLGESGTGKELVARAIHRQSARQTGPFIATNCAALSETLLESELFGHEKGAFTGAHKRKIGRFELASGGTLFLDEIGEISASFQAKLLRALEQKEIVRVGAGDTIAVDVRVIAATNRDLQQRVNDGAFRDDLFFRLNVFPIRVPPLRDRRDDVPLLAAFLLDNLGYTGGTLDDTVVERLRSYHWPGNVRELRNILERALILADGRPIKAADLGFLPESSASPGADESAPAQLGDDAGLEDTERRMIVDALTKAGGNKSKAARSLRITRRVLYTKLKKFGLE